ncbi:MAG: hypothetical protein JOZ69_05400 [Myxococcales bacterium]|nr:hypothetical protein [Myxococcales bacterium]
MLLVPIVVLCGCASAVETAGEVDAGPDGPVEVADAAPPQVDAEPPPDHVDAAEVDADAAPDHADAGVVVDAAIDHRLDAGAVADAAPDHEDAATEHVDAEAPEAAAPPACTPSAWPCGANQCGVAYDGCGTGAAHLVQCLTSAAMMAGRVDCSIQGTCSASYAGLSVTNGVTVGCDIGCALPLGCVPLTPSIPGSAWCCP